MAAHGNPSPLVMRTTPRIAPATNTTVDVGARNSILECSPFARGDFIESLRPSLRLRHKHLHPKPNGDGRREQTLRRCSEIRESRLYAAHGI